MTGARDVLSRRALLKGSAGLIIAVHLPSGPVGSKTVSAGAPWVPNAFVRISSDSIVTVLVKHTEIGQGVLTGLSTLVAEELDADWSQMVAEHAPADAEIYKNFRFGVQGTGGSTSMANSFEQMRLAGARARWMLLQAAAAAWDVPLAEISIEAGILQHPGSGRSGPFGDFVAAAAKLPVPDDVPLKAPSAFRLIGHDGRVRRIEGPNKSNGTALYVSDIDEPGQLTVVVAHPPRFGARLKNFDATAARAVRGVVDVRPIASGIAVYAEKTWPALKARERLEIQWDDTATETAGTDDLITSFRTMAQQPGAVAADHGNVEQALIGADRVIEAEYVFPYLAHAPMEPLCGFLAWDGQTALARLGSQIQTFDRQSIADALGLSLQAVQLKTELAGGSFGRRGEMESNFAIELAEAAKAIGPGRPIKLLWTREDDLRGGYYRALMVHRLRAASNGQKIQAWDHTIVGQSFGKGTPFEPYFIENNVDRTMVEGARRVPYKIPDFRCSLHIADVGVPVLWWRSVGHTHTGYAVECFVDEVLQANNLDPVAGRLRMMQPNSRLARALRAVADLAEWRGPGPDDGRARGVAVVESFGTAVAQIAEVSDGGAAGPQVHKVWCAVDCGIAVNPDMIRAQMEGGIGFGLGHALYAAVELKDGYVQQDNFDTYRSLRIHEMPEIEVSILPSTAPPSGVGEPGVPPIAPAVANALARLGMDRPARLPMVQETV